MSTADERRARVAAVPVWYHAMDLDGIETPGVWDMRPVVSRYGFPDSLEGQRCLDVGASNGFFSFHMEQLGAAEVVAADLPSFKDHDYPEWYLRKRLAEASESELADIDAGQLHGGFEVARGLLGSKVRKVSVKIYDLPDRFEDEFDLVLCSHVLVHVRDPIGGLEAMRSVMKSGGRLVLAVSADMSQPDASYARFLGDPERPCWWAPSPAAAVQMCRAVGFPDAALVDVFEIVACTDPSVSAHLAIVHATKP